MDISFPLTRNMEDTAGEENTAEPPLAETVLNLEPDEENKAYEKVDLPEKKENNIEKLVNYSISSGLLEREYGNGEESSIDSEQLAAPFLAETVHSEDFSEELKQLVERSEFMFSGFEELLQGSANLIDDLGKLIRNSAENGDDDSNASDKGDENMKNLNIATDATEETNTTNETSAVNLSALISLTTLRKASEKEKERIKQLQDQIKIMNANIRETDIFIKQCQKINDDLDEECCKLDDCNDDTNFKKQISHLCVEYPGTLREESTRRSQTQPLDVAVPEEMGDCYTVDTTAPNFDRWSMPYPHEAASLRLSTNFAEGEEQCLDFFEGTRYEELESIWELGADE